MRLDPKEIRGALVDLVARDTPPEIVEARPALRDALDYIRQLEGDLRRAGFTEYNDPKESEE